MALPSPPWLTRQVEVSGWYARRHSRRARVMRSSRQYQRGFQSVAVAVKYSGTPRSAASSTARGRLARTW